MGIRECLAQLQLIQAQGQGHERAGVGHAYEANAECLSAFRMHQMIGLVQGTRVFHEHRGLPAIESGRFFRVLRQGFQDFTDPAHRFFAEKNSPLLRKVLGSLR